MKNVISCQHLSKEYSSDFFLLKKRKALEDVSFHVSRGEVFGIVGPNGAGKSTTLKILMGFIQQSSGEATLYNLDANKSKSREKVGYLPENPTLYHNLTIHDHLKFACNVYNIQKEARKDKISRILHEVNLKEATNTPIRHFSKGMRQRAGLAYALINNPELLILDEPMSGLDPIGRQLVIDIIKHYHNLGTTILFCSHILTDVERVCNKIAIMDKGKILSIITPKDLGINCGVKKSDDGKSPLETFFLEQLEADIA